MKIKALSVVAPSGTLIASGEKTLEVRRWHPHIAPDEDLLIIENRHYLRQDGEEDPDGHAVALVRVKTVRTFERTDIAAACASYYEEGWLTWELTDIRPVSCGQRIIAARGIYQVELGDVLLTSGTLDQEEQGREP